MTCLRIERSPLAPILQIAAVRRIKARVTYMPESRVLAVLDLLAGAGVRAWVAGGWGVETAHRRILLCGAGARRGGGVSGIPGRNAAMAVLATRR